MSVCSFLLSRRLHFSLPRASRRVLSRTRSTSGKRFVSGYQAPGKEIPQSVLIYHAGTGRTVFVGALKITTIFLFFANMLIVEPAVARKSSLPWWMAPFGLYAAAGAVPVAYVMWASAPFVAFVHLRPPLAARRSKQALMKFVENVSPKTEFDFTTLKAFGRARVTRVPFGQLRPTKGSLGIQNIVRRSLIPPSSKRWWQISAQSSFYVGTNRLGVNAQGINKNEIWTKVFRQIRAKDDFA